MVNSNFMGASPFFLGFCYETLFKGKAPFFLPLQNSHNKYYTTRLGMYRKQREIVGRESW